MAIELAVVGNGKFRGSRSNLVSYQVDEESTPIDPNDTSGAVGSINFSVYEDASDTGSVLLLNDTVTLTDQSNGTTTGTVTGVSTVDGVAGVNADSRLGLLVNQVTAVPFTGTVGNAFRHYLGLAGISTGIVVDPAIEPSVRTNLFSNPSGRNVIAPATALGGTIGQDAGQDTYVISSVTSSAGNSGAAIQQFTVGTNLLANTQYTATVFIGAIGSSSAALYAVGAGAVATVVSPTVSAGTGLVSRSITFTTTSSGVVTIYVLNGTATVPGNIVYWHDGILEKGTSNGSYFDGNSITEFAWLDYYWTGAVDASTSSFGPGTVSLPNYVGSCWDIIKFMCTAFQVEVSLVSNNIVLRPLRAHTLNTLKDSTRTWNVQNAQLAQSIEIYYYNNTQVTNELVYPFGGYTPDIPTYQVDAGQTIVQNIPVNVSLTSLQQPTCVSFVAENYTGPSSVYAVAGNDGLPIPPAEWAAYDGSLSVAIGADGQSIDVTITGMTFNQAAPFTIGVSSGPSNYYSALRLIGSGVSFNQQKLTIPTGVDVAKAPQVVGVTVDNPQISTVAQAYAAGMKTAQAFAAPIRTIQATSTVVNRAGDKGSTNYPTFTNFAVQYPTQTFSQFDTLQSGQKFSDFTLAEFNLVKDNFDNQAFGNIAGSRVLFRQAYYRVRSATTDQGLINYSAEADTILSDFNTVNSGKTFSQFDTKFSGLKFQDFGVIPLWT